ncbi:pro-melanin-concentrating hormone, like [Xiphophorus hellerii]|uniref:pro-melanin-concentrating hormone, like n=1 Tax=Xiphophorus hellerii TaxID=8084 RepID=UPI0013B3E8F9|nr:pro-MCH-like [Xiphophorus hellerii]
MRRSLLSVTFAAALFLNCNAIPMGKTEDGSLEQEVFASILNDEAMEGVLGDADLASAARARASKVIVIAADPMIWRDLKVLQNGMSVYKRRADDSNQGGEHGDGGQQLSIPILRRDNMRCMVGRVYRPCWEV